MSAHLLVMLLRTPERAEALNAAQWNGVIATARAERLLATLAYRLKGQVAPDALGPILESARFDAEYEKRLALWEADRAMAALAPLDVPVLLLKGAAYVAASLKAGEGRMIGDLDILVSYERIGEVEAALLAAGWEWVKPDPYDDAYYRQWMHELPPLIHRERDRMIDVHHTILPLTARPMPDAQALLADAVRLPNGLCLLSPEDRVCHAVAHMLADGDLDGGLRNLWDISCLISEIDNISALESRARHHGLHMHLARACRLVDHLYGKGKMRLTWADRLFVRRLLARNNWGSDSRKFLGLGFYVRSHLLRMPPLMLARHLWTKWRNGHRPI